MEEKVIVESRRNSRSLFILTAIALVFVLVAIILFATMNESKQEYSYYYHYTVTTTSLNPGKMYAGIVFMALAVIMFTLMFFYIGKIKVTDKRVVLVGPFGYEKTLPLNCITSNKISLFGSVMIGTSSAKIRKLFVANKTELIHTLNRIILENK